MEKGLHARTFVTESHGIAELWNMLQAAYKVAVGLIGDRAEGPARFFCFNSADRFSIDEQEIIGRAGLGGILTDSNAKRCAKVELLVLLDAPTCGGQKSVYIFASFLFGGQEDSFGTCCRIR